MNSRTVITTVALGRLGLGAAMMVAPGKLVGQGWIGAEATRPLASLMIRAVGARDVALAVGTLMALRQGSSLKPWLVGGAIADGTDCVATAAAGAAVPTASRIGVAALAGGGLATQLALLPSVE